MKKLILLIICFAWLQNSNAQNKNLSPFFTVGTSNSEITDLINTVKEGLVGQDFNIIGEYHPEKNKDLYVVCLTRPDLRKLCLESEDRGALASVLKIGMVKKANEVTISMINPDYMFCAYLSNYDSQKEAYTKITDDLKKSLLKIGNDFTPFGGELSANAIKKYHYKMMMPYFKDPVELNQFNTFEEGLATIRKNLKDEKGKTKLIYEQLFEDQKIAVFGIGLLDPEDGEKEFLPIIGEDHIAAMPYEIILQGKEATMLHGKYRFALYWPELTMGTFMKIMSTPGNVEEFMESVTK
ncbi:hypothetical protein L3049_13285 [Labilibaculum sp. DW002]|uniref:DUF302 domain-containing protein n=1 Tax=Paralabilibaculum antarcticum TaxID=2912572 RepID=A0ABT5VU83_9BACT|nr:hypothetical protein [Labilibaculum sp. DW002]MDE5418973.1 hypothetical protein [Labilibaculum sp. DW002]